MTEGKPEKVPRSASSGSKIHSQDLVDRISDLPDPILSHIISFLPTKNSVATSILSQRWKFMWTTVPDFDFSNINSLYISKTDWDLRDSQIEANLVKFIQFVNRVFLLRAPGSINNFSLVWEAQSISSDVNSWINTAISNEVQNLILTIYVENHVLTFETFPRIFSCQSLQSLVFKCNSVIHSANIVHLARLETLELYSICFEDEEVFRKLILGCPVLKCLCISTQLDHDEHLDEPIEDENIFRFMVHSTSLRRLKMHIFGDLLPHLCYCSLELETPSLEYIKLQGLVSRIFLQGSLSSLLEVDFEINTCAFVGADEFMEYSCDYVVEAVRAFSCAKHITLSTHVMEALSNSGISLNTTFERLTKLRVITYPSYRWTDLHDCMKLIQWSDNLQVIAFDKGSNCDLGGEVPGCLTNSLKEVLFYAFEGSEHEMAMIGYFLKNGSVLELVQVHCSVQPSSKDYKTKFEMLQRITKFSRKSSSCEIEFC